MASVIDALLVTLGLDASKFNQGASSASKSMGAMEQSSRTLGNQFESTTNKLTNGVRQARNQLLELYALLTVGRGFKQLIADTLEGDRKTYQFAKAIGVSTQTLSTWQIAAERAGGTAEGMAATFGRITESINESLIQGSSAGLQKFVNFGVEVADKATGQALSVEQILLNTQKRIMESGQKRSVVQSWFGDTIDQGTMALLYETPQKLQQSLSEARKHGVANDADGQRAQKLLNDLNNVRQTVNDIVRNIIREFGPEIEKGLRDFDNWLVKAKPEIIGLIGDIGTSLKGFDWKGLFTEFESFAKGVNTIVQALGGWKNVSIELFTIWGAAKVAGLIKNIALAVGWLAIGRTAAGAGAAAATGGAAAAAGGATAAAGGGGLMAGIGAVASRLLGLTPWAVGAGIALTPTQAGPSNERALVEEQRRRAEAGEDLSQMPQEDKDRVAKANAGPAAAQLSQTYHTLPAFESYNSAREIVEEQKRTTAEIKRLADQFMQKNFGASLAQVTESMGLGVGGGLGGGIGGGGGRPVNRSKAAKEAYDFYISHGFTPEGAAGMVANEQQESRGDPNARGDKGTAGGLYQWHQGRRDAIMRRTGIDVYNASADKQREAFMLEGQLRIDPQWGAHYDSVKNAKNAGWAGSEVSMYAERPLLAVQEAANRGKAAMGYHGLYATNGAGAGQDNMMRQDNQFRGPESLRVSDNNSSRPTSVTVNTLNVNTQATDAAGIARDARRALNNTYNSNSGLR